jgi:Uma2 family endonuclease
MSSTIGNTSTSDVPFAVGGGIPPLEAGDHLDQKTFHRRYEAMPEHFRAELIGGVVYMASPLKRSHATTQAECMRWLLTYNHATPGTEVPDGASVILGERSELQPDACLIIAPEKHGATRDVDEYYVGPPELIVEVASSSESYDLHSKKADYEHGGVQEYVVVLIRQSKVVWFALRNGKYVELTPDASGIIRSEVFPGLWLDPVALLKRDATRVLAVVQQGFATPEHTAFVEKLNRP